jgi:hypothetical protein
VTGTGIPAVAAFIAFPRGFIVSAFWTFFRIRHITSKSKGRQTFNTNPLKGQLRSPTPIHLNVKKPKKKRSNGDVLLIVRPNMGPEIDNIFKSLDIFFKLLYCSLYSVSKRGI